MTEQALCQKAIDMLDMAYVPYSHFPVGAALLCRDGTVFTGYYNADATDKAVFAHNIQSDIVTDIIKANADTIRGILEDGK